MPGNATINDVSGQMFDIVVVGGGTAGLCLAAKLSDNPNLSVLVLDAGEVSVDDPKILLPGQYGVHFGQEEYDWSFKTTPQKFSNGRQVDWNRGKVLGGSSAINFMCWTKPSVQEVDDWERLGNPGWNWANFERHLHAIEGYHPPLAKSVAAHGLNFDHYNLGKEGPVKLYHCATITRPERYAYQTALNLGIQPAPAPMGGDTNGVYFAPKSINHEDYTRSYSVTAFYEKYKDRPNFRVLTRAYVTRLVTSTGDKLKADGVEFSYDGRIHVVKVGKEAVLSAGALKSPQILELSGVGRREVLGSIGVPVKLDLPGVGENIQEHMFSGMSFELADGVDDITMDALRDPSQLAEQARLHKLEEGSHTLGITGFVFAPMAKISDRAKELYDAAKKKVADNWSSYPEGLKEQYKIQLERLDNGCAPCEVVLTPGFLTFPNPPVPGKKYFTLLFCLNHPFSRGTIHAISSDPAKDPEFDPHYFEHDLDLQTFVELCKFARKMSKTAPLRDLLKENPEINPGVDVDSDSKLGEFIKNYASTTFHTIGSLSMLPHEKGGVVDSNLKVYGTSNIRVADLSVIPLHLAAHTLSLAYAIGSYGAEIIKNTL